MDNTEQNGHKNPRMDRLEGMMEMLIADHVSFNEEHKKLLTAQVLLTDSMQKTAVAQKELAEAQTATEGRMTILIGMMDTFIRERGEKH